MATLREITTAIEQQLDTIPGLQVASFPDPDLPTPMAWPSFTGWMPSSMGRQGWIEANFEVHVFTAGTVRTEDGYRQLLDLADWTASGQSISTALWDGNDQAAGTFCGLASTSLSMNVDQGFTQLGVSEANEFQLNGGMFAVTVLTKGTG
jgi:hypothetical protein